MTGGFVLKTLSFSRLSFALNRLYWANRLANSSEVFVVRRDHRQYSESIVERQVAVTARYNFPYRSLPVIIGGCCLIAEYSGDTETGHAADPVRHKQLLEQTRESPFAF